MSRANCTRDQCASCCKSNDCFHHVISEIPIALRFNFFNRPPYEQRFICVHPRLSAVHLLFMRSTFTHQSDYCNCPRPKRLIRLSIAVPNDTKPNIRSKGNVTFVTTLLNLTHGSSAMNSRSPGNNW
jgi:hypothetical protein